MSEEHNPLLPKLERSPEKSEALPISIAEQFLTHTLGEGRYTVYEGEKNKVWRLLDKQIQIPGIGPALMRVEYHKEFKDEGHKELNFETLRFDFYTEKLNEQGTRDRISEMWWKRTPPGTENKYPYDLQQVHRYTHPKFRQSEATKYTYAISETFPQQLADLIGKDLTIGFSTDQPKTMDWVERRGYHPYPEEAELREEVKEHPERFVPVERHSEVGQVRNTAIERDGEEVRLWFYKVLSPKQKP